MRLCYHSSCENFDIVKRFDIFEHISPTSITLADTSMPLYVIVTVRHGDATAFQSFARLFHSEFKDYKNVKLLVAFLKDKGREVSDFEPPKKLLYVLKAQAVHYLYNDGEEPWLMIQFKVEKSTAVLRAS